jgi:hypothetical protein
MRTTTPPHSAQRSLSMLFPYLTLFVGILNGVYEVVRQAFENQTCASFRASSGQTRLSGRAPFITASANFIDQDRWREIQASTGE